MDTLRIARDPSETNCSSREQAERLGNAFAAYWAEVRSELVTKEHLDMRLAQLETKLEARLETSLASAQNKILAAQVALFVLLGVAIYFIEPPLTPPRLARAFRLAAPPPGRGWLGPS